MSLTALVLILPTLAKLVTDNEPNVPTVVILLWFAVVILPVNVAPETSPVADTVVALITLAPVMLPPVPEPVTILPGTFKLPLE